MAAHRAVLDLSTENQTRSVVRLIEAPWISICPRICKNGALDGRKRTFAGRVVSPLGAIIADGA